MSQDEGDTEEDTEGNKRQDDIEQLKAALREGDKEAASELARRYLVRHSRLIRVGRRLDAVFNNKLLICLAYVALVHLFSCVFYIVWVNSLPSAVTWIAPKSIFFDFTDLHLLIAVFSLGSLAWFLLGYWYSGVFSVKLSSALTISLLFLLCFMVIKIPWVDGVYAFPSVVPVETQDCDASRFESTPFEK
jgi:hypothetical protein